MSYGVTPTDIADRWRPLDAEEESAAEYLIADAAVQVNSKRPQVAALVLAAPGGTVHLAVQQVIRDAVFNVLANPDQYKGQTVGADGTITLRFRTSDDFTEGQSMLRVVISDSDLALIDSAIYGPLSMPGHQGPYFMPLWDPDPVTI